MTLLHASIYPIPIKYEDDEVERNLSGKCTILCYILEYIYIVQIEKRRISSVFALNMQIPDHVECLVVFAFWKQTQDLCVSLLFVHYRYIFQYVKKTVHSHDIIRSSSSLSYL